MSTGRLPVYVDSNGYAACYPGTLTPIMRKATKTIRRKADRRRRARIAQASRRANRSS